MPAFWMVLGALLSISSLLNGAAFVNADATGTRVFRGILSMVLLAAAFLAFRKGLADMGRSPGSDMNPTSRRRRR
jgi:hypothetical protein